MSEEFIRHFVSFIATLIVLITFYAGYVSGQNGLWWSGFFAIIIYVVVFKILDV